MRISKLIKLEKPLVVFDLETTGLSVNLDRIIELAYLKISPEGKITQEDLLFNPEINIPKEVTEINGLTDEIVKDKPLFRDQAKDLLEVFNGCDFGGFNVMTFDLPFLRREFLRAGLNFDYAPCKIIDSKVIYHYMEPRTLSAAYKFYCQKEHEEAHNALGDVMATAEILGQQLKQYKELCDWSFIHKIHHAGQDRYVDNDRKFYWRNGEAYFAFSKHKDKPLAEVAGSDPGFLNWILSADFSDETKEIVSKALRGEMPKKVQSI